MEKRQLPGLVGSVLLLVGLFVPIVRVLPGSMSLNYFSYRNSGKILLGLAIVSLIVTLLKKYKALWLTGLASLGLILYDLYDLQSLQAKARLIPGYERFDPSAAQFDQFQSALLEAHSQFIRQSVAFEWKGWAVLITGAVLIVVAALLGGMLTGQQEFLSTVQPINGDPTPAGNVSATG